MRAMILAAGRGERMRPLTDRTPKPLLQVAGQALIEYHIKALVKAGIKDIIINHAWLGQQIEDYLGNGQRYAANLVYSAEIPAALETAGGIIQALPLLGDDPFIVINGDIWCDYPLMQLITEPKGLAHLIMVNNPEHNPQGDFAFNDHYLAQDGSEKFTFSGIGLYRTELFAGLSQGARPLAPLLREAMQRQQITGELYQGQWYDIGTPQRLRELDTLLLQR